MSKTEEQVRAPEQAAPTPPTPQPPPHYAPSVNGFAIASLVLGIVWLMGIGSILALVFGYVGKSQIDASGGRETGQGFAIAGIVLGYVGLAILLTMGGLWGFDFWDGDGGMMDGGGMM
jgi:hypothetical protein